DDSVQPVSFRRAPGARRAGKRLLACPKPRLSRRGTAALAGMAAAAGGPGLFFFWCAGDPSRRLARRLWPLGGAASCGSGAPGGCINEEPRLGRWSTAFLIGGDPIGPRR